MARVRSVDFLPEIFQTNTNKQFLAATLDQLVQEPNFTRIQGYVGRRVGPGVNANDEYVKEESAVRTNYQLEPGVVVKDANDNVSDVITYPGITDALNVAGSFTDDASRLYTSDYYTWDPFVDFDKFVNYGQYYWLPGGPDAVNVFAGEVPLTQTFDVTRSNGVYTFTNEQGTNPVLTLLRGGNYTFNVSQNNTETVNFRVTNNTTSAYVIDYQPNPTLTLVRGNTYVFTLVLKGDFPFYIKSQLTLGTTNLYQGTLPDGSAAIVNNGARTGTITFTVPQDAPDTLYYTNNIQSNMHGTINIVDGQAGTGPGFWIQVEPGVNGKLATSSNISSRDVLGVINNGEDLGTVTFNVPLVDAQQFYYDLTTIQPVDFITSLAFNQINNQPLALFLAEYGGLDGIQNINGKTLVFQAREDGWERTVIGSGFGGGFDSATEITDPAERYSIWQVEYVTIDGTEYITLNSIQVVNQYEKFTILYGVQYASTQWFKSAVGVFEQVPLLSAVKDVLWYQDGTDPEIFGQIRILNQTSASQLNIADIIGKKNYTSPNGVVFTNGLKVTFVGDVVPTSYINQTYYVEGVGTAIKLLPVGDFVTPETYTQSATVPYDSTPFDVGNFDSSLNQPLIPDYLTINRASNDLNPWTRSNRWFHIDVINAAASYNNTVARLDNNFRGKRPIIEFRANTKLFDFGTEGKQPVNIIDFSATDALSTINGTPGYGVDGYTFIDGSRVIFAADTNPEVRNKIYTVEFITPDTVAPLIAEPIINLVPAADANVLINQTVVCLSGITLQGKSFYYDGVEWLSAQQKTATNQAPLFDVYDSVGVSLGNKSKYPSSNFVGSKLFSYATGTGQEDPVLGFPLKYLSLANVGDIVFDNNLYADQFTYTKENITTVENISIGYVREYINRVDFVKEIGWQNAVTKSLIRQQFRFNYDGSPLKLDVSVNQNLSIPALQIYVGSTFKDPGTYSVEVTDDTTTIVLDQTFFIGDVIEVDALSSQTSKVAFYQVPVNLENNPLNQNSNRFSLGTIRNHYETICYNLKTIVGPANGANNTRDLGNIIPYGQNILQQSSPLTLTGFFMRSNEYNIFNSIEYNSREYEKFKAQLLDTATRNDYTNYTIPDMLTAIVSEITAGRTSNSPFYWSDMLPASSVYTQTKTTVTPLTTNVFDLSTTYDFTSSNYKSVLAYINNRLLTVGVDYIIDPDSPRLTVLTTLSVGDVVTINEYATTYGTFVPNTPTKMGLWPAYRPRIYVDTNYVNPQTVIQGHDGSLTMAFGDFRDELLLEFETRIFNNLKVKSEIPLPVTEVVPGQFRTTDYTLSEINQILAKDFLSWIGWNKLNYQAQDYIANNEFTWNYSTSGNLLSGPNETPLPVGAWRGLYLYFYDTASPNTTPWEMLGFSIKPDWWTDVYGSAPYTRDNLVLWDDLEAGRVADPAGEYILPQYARPGLTKVIPTGPSGELLSPFDCVVGSYDSSQFQKSWTFGDGGPVEYSWIKSSSYPFAAMRMLALTRPAEFFSLFVDRDLYKFDTEYDQYLYNGRYRLDANGIQVYGDGTSKASYINWIVDYNRQLGINSTTVLEDILTKLDVRLCYRLGAFTDKQYLKIYLEKSSPDSLNSSLLLPDESYDLLLYKNQPFERVVYSSVIVQVVEDGYAVYGNSITAPYFDVLVSKTYGTKTTIFAGGEGVTVPNQYTEDVVQVPYGYVFTNKTVVVDFLLSYGALLASQGLVFDSVDNGRILNWAQMAQEFLYWANQGWSVGSVINLNPSAFSITAVKPQAVVDNIVVRTPENGLLDQNRTSLPLSDIVIDRQENTFTVSSLTQQSIAYLDLKFTAYENIVILDNVSLFNDLIFDPVTGARQNRINISATVSADWNGTLDAQGFILNNPQTIREWEPNVKYAKGEIVIYKSNYWSAQTIVQPKVEFDYNDWVKSDYTKIQRGLLLNAPNQSNQLANSYSVYNANLENDQDLVSYGLIGFRPRQYMTALNLDDVSQVNVYSQFLKDKGTIRSVRLLGNTNTGKEVGEYDIFENWAVLKSTYGANANRSFIELRLNEAQLLSDPSVIQVTLPGQTSTADQTILLSNLWRQSYKIPNTNILTTTTIPVQDSALPTAGYVNLNDVDITVFSLDTRLSLAPGVLDTIGVGTTVWAAKTNAYDWGVFRCNSVPGFLTSATTNLDTTSRLTFTKQHGLSVGDVIIVRFFDDTVNGVYTVLAVPSPTAIVVELPLTRDINSNGVVLVLETMRVAQASDVINLPYANNFIAGAKVWVDNNGDNLWTVLEKQTPFVYRDNIAYTLPIYNSKFGASISQGKNNLVALVGSPGYSTTGFGTQVGAVYAYLRNNFGNYGLTSILTLNATGVLGFGNAVDVGQSNWTVAGASASNNNQGYASVIYRPSDANSYIETQLLVAPDQDFGPIEFGHSVSMSQDERWLYVGAPGGNKVYAYGRVDIEDQFVRLKTTGTTAVYSFGTNIVFDVANPEQLSVIYNNKLLEYGLDYSVTASSITLTFIPPAGQDLIIRRKQSQQLDSKTYYDVTQTSTSGSGLGAKFTVNNVRGTYSVSLTNGGTGYSVADTVTISGATLGTDNSGTTSSYPQNPTSPANDLVITVTSVVGGVITGFTKSGSGISNNTVFGISPYLYTATDIYSLTVTVDGVLQRPFIDFDFNTDSAAFDQEIVFNTVPPAGATIAVSTGTYFAPVATLSVDGIASNARFGTSITQSTEGRQILIGAPLDDSDTVDNSGSVYAFDRNVIRYIISDPTSNTFTLPGGWAAPVAVILNNTYLEDAGQYIDGQFSISGSTVTVTAPLAVGDILEIENNIFNQVQKINAAAPYSEDSYGFSVDMCPNSCSLYVGSPTDSTVETNAGSVERRVNQSRVYGVTSSTANPVLTAGDTIRINNMPVAVPAAPNNTVDGLAAAINLASIPNVNAAVSQGVLTLSVINVEAATPFDRLTVLPGVSGTAFEDLGFVTYAYTQTIVSPNPVLGAQFGYAVNIDSEADNLVVGAPEGQLYEPTTFDNGTTYFDDRSTTVFNSVDESGAVYTFDYLPGASMTIADPGKFVFGQQVYNNSVQYQDQWGTAVSYVSGKLLIGAPGSDLGDSTANYGRVAVFENPNRQLAWTPIHTQAPVADTQLLNSVFMYDRLDSSRTYFLDYINPLQGKILGAARQNIDFISTYDPAKYNVGDLNNNGNFWEKDRVGQIWWDITSVRFIDPNQDDLTYASRRWAQTFPGSKIEIYQWTQSEVPPSQYTGPGTVKTVDNYVVKTSLNNQGTFTTYYYFWVTGLDIIDTQAGKTLSTTGIARYIENPKSSGIPYLAALNANTVAIYNSLEYLSAADTILHIEYDREYTNDNIHTEYELIAENNPDSFLSAGLYRKLQDSFCGVNSVGALVPDPTLTVAERYGVQFRPRQSMFVDRFGALENYLTRTNSVLAQYPITESRTFILLNSSEPEPSSTSGEWNKRLANIEELSYQNLYAVPLGYKYLIVSDSNNGGLWTIYTVIQETGLVGAPRTTQLSRVQTYDTRKYWQYIDWYEIGYNKFTVPVAEVPNYSGLASVTVPVGATVRVTSNAQGKWEIYQKTSTGWNRVALQDGTIEFKEELWNYQVGKFGFDVEVYDSQYFDQEPVIETRKIIQAINEELFIAELAIERNKLLILTFDYVLSEQLAPDWLTKTSLIDVNHRIRQLLPYQNYLRDNQDFVLDYIQEVKPYHVQIRQFNLAYDGLDSYFGDLSDFDVPAYYDQSLIIPQYVSPILLPYTKSTAVGTGTPSQVADTEPDAEIWTKWPWSQWYNNYLLSIQEVVVTDSGVGYSVAPDVVVTGECITPATMVAVVNSAGRVVNIDVIDPGQGYSTTAIISLVGGNGVGAKAIAVMGNNLVRSIKTTIKYDRYQYSSTIEDWQPNTMYDNGTQVRYDNRVWEANNPDSTAVESAIFDPEQWTLVSAGSLSGIDRTQGFYTADVNEPGLDLPQLITGLAYPGVQVVGVDFNQNTGFDIGNFDINPYDNISYGPEGLPTYDPAILDAIYQSFYGTPATGPIPTGTAATDINVDGGGYVDTYSSYAPEELVPGAEFDTLDFRVYTRQGSDWLFNGHGFKEEVFSFTYDSASPPTSYADVVPYPIQLVVYNGSLGLELVPGVDYQVDWVAQTIEIINGVADGQVVSVYVYSIGGGNQLYRNTYVGNQIANNKIEVPVSYTEIISLALFVNGVNTTNYTYQSAGTGKTEILLNQTYTVNDYLSLTVMGATTGEDGSTIFDYSWSTAVKQTIIADGSSLSFDLDNSVEYTNPVNLVVTVNGRRARTASCVEYYGDGSSAFLLPTRLGFSEALISNNEVLVYINDIPQVYGTDFVLEPWTGDHRQVVFSVTPEPEDRILIGVVTNAQARVNGTQLYFDPTQGIVPIAGDLIEVTTWNDTRQQDILTQLFVGPDDLTIAVSEGYDDTNYDAASTSFTAGSFDYASNPIIQANNFVLQRTITDPTRLWVTLNGVRQFYGEDFTIANGNEVVLASGLINATDTVIVSMFTESTVPEAIEFRIFQDMRGLQSTYRMTPGSTTVLVQDLSEYDDVIYVQDASALDEPDLVANIWGSITINGERILYRERNTVNNTVSSLRRGTAGTGATSHSAGSIVYSLGLGNYLPQQFQNYIDSNYFTADGTTTTFVADNVTFNTGETVLANAAVEVYVGGLKVTTGYTISAINPVTVVFDVAPTNGYGVNILVRRGVTWYAPGAGTPSNGVPLQDTNTQAARFLRGL